MSKAIFLHFLVLALGMAALAGCDRGNSRLNTVVSWDASVKGDLPWQPQSGRVITLWTDQENATMSTLYGNGMAASAARSPDHSRYPVGTSVALVTWKQKEDERWFGASIPSTVQSVEFVTITAAPLGRSLYLYQRYSGNPLRPFQAQKMSNPQGRVEEILSQHAANMP